jgi:hypothetical protein
VKKIENSILRDEGLKEEIAAIKQTTTGKWRFDPVCASLIYTEVTL